MSGLTFNQHIEAALELAEQARASSTTGAEARDLALAITHLEDGLTRYNSARYRHNGTWKRADPDAALVVVEAS